MNASGSLITFYSFKGGLGRSMAVANIGRVLARGGSKLILLIDWDLEAPGLEAYFHESDQAERGLIEYFTALAEMLRQNSDFASALAGSDGAGELYRALPLDAYVVDSGAPGVSLLLATGTGRATTRTYQDAIARFDWVGLFEKTPQAIAAFRGMLASSYDYVLIDSRTGVSDISGMCTAILPDRLVAMFGPSRQSLGVLEIAKAAVQFRRISDDDRPLVVFPLASRFDTAVLHAFQRAFKEAREDFTKLFLDIYGLSECELDEYFQNAMLLYVPHYAYGEPNVVDGDEPDYAGSLRRGYETFAGIIATRDVPWE